MISVLLGLHTLLLLVFYAVTSRKYTEGCSGQGRALIKKINSNVVYMDHLLRTYSLSYGQFYVLNRRHRKSKVKRF